MNTRAQQQQTFAMRPLLPDDVPLLAEIFRSSIEELTADDYSDAQREAWASAADDEEEFGARLSRELSLVATHEGAAIAFAALADNTDEDRFGRLHTPRSVKDSVCNPQEIGNAVERLLDADNQQRPGDGPSIETHRWTLGHALRSSATIGAKSVSNTSIFASA